MTAFATGIGRLGARAAPAIRALMTKAGQAGRAAVEGESVVLARVKSVSDYLKKNKGVKIKETLPDGQSLKVVFSDGHVIKTYPFGRGNFVKTHSSTGYRTPRGVELKQKVLDEAMATGAPVNAIRERMIRDLVARRGGVKRKSLATRVEAHPGAYLAGAAGTAFLLGEEAVAPLGRAVWDEITGRGDSDLREAASATVEGRRLLVSEAMRAERLRRDAEANLENLARVNPRLYQQIAAGRQLPEDGVIIGAEPKVDMLTEVAMMMAQGGFQEQASLADQYAHMLR